MGKDELLKYAVALKQEVDNLTLTYNGSTSATIGPSSMVPVKEKTVQDRINSFK